MFRAWATEYLFLHLGLSEPNLLSSEVVAGGTAAGVLLCQLLQTEAGLLQVLWKLDPSDLAGASCSCPVPAQQAAAAKCRLLACSDCID